MVRLLSNRALGVLVFLIVIVLGILGVQFLTPLTQFTVAQVETARTAVAPSVATRRAIRSKTANSPPVQTQRASRSETAMTHKAPPLLTDSYAMMPLPPGSIWELVKGSDIIVVGRISRFVKEGMEGPYGADSKPSTTTPMPTPLVGTAVPQPGNFPSSYFELEILQVVANSHHITLPKLVLLRSGGFYSTRSMTLDPPYYEVGDQYLYALRTNPDGTYGTGFGFWGRFDMQGDVVTFVNRAHTPITFTEQKAPDAFIGAIQEEAAKQ